jgi:hypothetical protein
MTCVVLVCCRCVYTLRMKYGTECLTTDVTTEHMFIFLFLFSEDIVSVIDNVIFPQDDWQS